jgi:hypothetical protein
MLEDGNALALRAEAFDPSGRRVASFPSIGVPAQLTATADPVVAPLPGGTYAVLWTDVGGDGDEDGVAVASLNATTGAVSSAGHVNQTTSFAQHGADALWTGTALIVAWTDESDAATLANVKMRSFDAALHATTDETDLAKTAASESDVVLAPFGGAWAASWRAVAGDSETIHVRTASGAEYTVGPLVGGVAGERPALVALGRTSLLVAFSVALPGSATGATKVQTALIDTTQPGGSLTPVDWQVSGTNSDGTTILPQAAPAAVVAGTTLWAGSWTGPGSGDTSGENVWLAPLDLASPVKGMASPLPRLPAHRGGDQRRPALAMAGTSTANVLVAAWDDDGQTLAPIDAKQDVVLAVMPLVASGRQTSPIARAANPWR